MEPQPQQQLTPEQLVHQLSAQNAALVATVQSQGSKLGMLEADLSMTRSGLQSVSQYATKLEKELADLTAEKAALQTTVATQGNEIEELKKERATLFTNEGILALAEVVANDDLAKARAERDAAEKG
jgi:chromosome segregation ATPase